MWAHLRRIFPRAEQPKLIALAIREKHGTVRKEMSRLEASGHVVNVDRTGWYRAWADADILHRAEQVEPAIHALQFTAPLPLGRGLPPPRGALQARLRGDERWGVSEEDKAAFLRERISGRSLEVRAFQTGTLLFSVSATDVPIRGGEWPEFYGELRGFARGLGVDLDSPFALLVNVEFNVDWSSFFMSGVKRLKVTQFSRTWAQIYQKHRDTLRMEIRVAPRDVSVSEAARAMMILAHGSRVAAVPEIPPPDPYSPEVA